MKNKISNVIDINWIDKTSRAAIIPGYSNKKKIPKLKELTKSKGNCLFSSGISHAMIDFIYRSVIKLNLKDKKLIFSRGAVKVNNRPAANAVSIRELDWDVGTSIRIPHRLKYNYKIEFITENSKSEIKLMELIVLSALIHIAYPAKKSLWCSEMAGKIILNGWHAFENQA